MPAAPSDERSPSVEDREERFNVREQRDEIL
jgi:hypothetical protein